MTVTQKKHEIAILKSIGATNKFISNIYLLEGSLIGVIGTTVGLILGIGLSMGQQHFKWLKFDANNAIFDAIPIVINHFDIIIVTSFSLLLSFIATIYPAKKANQLNISQAIRDDN
jgi:lipoprotein-releasing system permease protein